MFKCVIVLPLPVRHPGEVENSGFLIAEYGFDPGLILGEGVCVAEASFVRITTEDGKQIKGDGPFFSFDARVVERIKLVAPKPGGDELTLFIKLEMADKEQMPEIIELYKKYHPDAKDLREQS